MTTTKQSWFKRGLSGILAAAMVLSMNAVSVFAAGTDELPADARQAIHLDIPAEDGVYYADIELMNASNPNQTSMGNAALRGSSSYLSKQPEDTDYRPMVVVEDGKATAIVEFMPMGYVGMYGFMMELESVTPEAFSKYGSPLDDYTVYTPASVLAQHKTSSGETVYDLFNDPDSESKFDGTTSRPAGFGHDEARPVDIVGDPYPHILALDVTPVTMEGIDLPEEGNAESYDANHAAYVHVFVPVMFSISPSTGDQYARMQVDWTSLEKVENPEDNVQYQLYLAKKVEQGNYTNVSYQALQTAIGEVETALANIWPSQDIEMSGSGLQAAPVLNQKEFTEEENAEMAGKLADAMKALAEKGDKTDLNALITEASAKQEAVYTPASWAPFAEKLAAAKTVQENEDAVEADVTKAVSELKAAMDALVERGDKTSLNELIADAEEKQEEEYTTESWKAFSEKLAAAKAVQTDDNATDADITAAVNGLEEAMGALVERGDKTELNTLVTEADAKLEENYTPDSWAPFEEKLAAAKTVQDNTDATKEDVAVAVSELKAAMEALMERANFDDLNALIAKAEGLNKKDYTEDSYEALTEALESAKNVAGDMNAEQRAVDAQATALQAAIDSLKKAGELDKNDLEDGVYSIYGEMIKMNRVDKSMSNDAINHTIKLTVEDGQYYLTLDFKGLSYLNRFGYLAELSYYEDGYTYGQYGAVEGNRKAAQVLSTQKNADGSDVTDEFNQAGGSYEGKLYPDLIKFPLVADALADEDGYVPLHVFVPVMEDISEGTGDQDVLLKLDWSTLKETTEDDPDFEPDEPVEQSPAVDVTDTNSGVKVYADKGVFEEGVQLVVDAITSGEDYEAAVSALSDVGKKFKLYEIHFEDADGNEVQPNGMVTVLYPIPKGYDEDKLVLYRINEDGTKTLVKGTVDNGFYKVVTKSFSTYALVESGSTITDAENTANIPQTGDESNVAVFALLALAAAGMMGVALVSRKRKSRES